MEVRVRRILVIGLVFFGGHRLLDERGVPLLRYNTQLSIILTTYGCLLALLLRALLEVEQRRVVHVRLLQLVLRAAER